MTLCAVLWDESSAGHHSLVEVVMFSPLFVCLFVTEITQKVTGEFHEIWGISTLRTGEGLVKFWRWSRVYSGISWIFSVYHLFSCWASHRMESLYTHTCNPPVQLYTYNCQYHWHLLASNNTVPISVWRSRGVHSSECPLVFIVEGTKCSIMLSDDFLNSVQSCWAFVSFFSV